MLKLTIISLRYYVSRPIDSALPVETQLFQLYKGDGFIALYTQHPYRWLQDESGRDIEVRVDAPDNIWVCEMGNQVQWGDFSRFVQVVTNAQIHCEDLQVKYESPSLGSVAFGWKSPLLVAGQQVLLHNYERFDNPYCRCAFMAPQVVIQRKGEKLDFEQNERPDGNELPHYEPKVSAIQA